MTRHPAKKNAHWLALAMAAKYVGDQGAARYVENTINEPRALLKVALAAAKVSSWRMPVEGEPAMGIWANRYYQPETQF